MNFYGDTNIGKVREMNQDYFDIVELNNATALIVCDGMGGANGGNIASQTAAKTIADFIKDSFKQKTDDEDIPLILKNAVLAGNMSVFDKAEVNEDLRGMGTTAVVAYVCGNFAHIVHAGDSRAYLLRGNKLSQITKDHSIVRYLLDCGQITAEEARVHPRRNVITRALGVDDTIETDYNRIKLESGDRLLICTDGLTNFVSDDEIVNILKNQQKQDATKKLIEAANNNGGRDNITAVVAYMD